MIIFAVLNRCLPLDSLIQLGNAAQNIVVGNNYSLTDSENKTITHEAMDVAVKWVKII